MFDIHFQFPYIHIYGMCVCVNSFFFNNQFERIWKIRENSNDKTRQR